MKALIKLIIYCSIIYVFSLINTYYLNDIYYKQSFIPSYKVKHKIAEQHQQNKIIVIGGSSTNLGFDSITFEELSGINTVNLAIDASIPLRVYLQMAKENSNKGDTIILILEEGYYHNFWDCSDSYFDCITYSQAFVKDKNLYTRYKNLYLMKKIRGFSRLNDIFYTKLRNSFEQPSIYNGNPTNFNSHGDFIAHKGLQATYTRKQVKGKKFTSAPTTISQIKKFIVDCEKNGINVFISYPPIDGERRLNHIVFSNSMHNDLISNFGKKYIIGYPEDFSYEEDCFFDTHQHLKYEYRSKYTKDFFEQFLEKLNIYNQIDKNK